jgi:hypothetical protein
MRLLTVILKGHPHRNNLVLYQVQEGAYGISEDGAYFACTDNYDDDGRLIYWYRA